MKQLRHWKNTVGLKDLLQGLEALDLALFPGREVGRVEEQTYDPTHSRRFWYERRKDLEASLLSSKNDREI
ncbi:hypothetical protein YIM730264_20320 [Thermus hydrothermalis]